MTSDFYADYREARRNRLYRKQFDESKINRAGDGTFASKASGAIKRAALDLSIHAAEHLPKILQGMMGPAMASSVERAIESDTPTVKFRVKKSDYEQAKPMSLKHGYKTPGHFIGAVARLKGAGEDFEYHGSVPPRTEKESDKSYAKRAVKDLPQPKSLPETPENYFHVDKATKSVPLSSLTPTRARKSGIANAARFMRMAFEGLSAKRDPISVSDNGDGTFEIIDGNSTFAAMKKYGWDKAPVKVVNRQSAEQARRIGERWDYSRKRPWDEKKHPRDSDGKFASKGAAKASDAGGRESAVVLKRARQFRFLSTSLATKDHITKSEIDDYLNDRHPPEKNGVSALKKLSIEFPKKKKASQSKKWVYTGPCCEVGEDGTPLKNEDGSPKVTPEFVKAGERLRAEAEKVQPIFMNAMSGVVAREIRGDTKPTKLHVFDSGENFEKGKAVVSKYPDHPHVMVGGVKGMRRAAEKAASKGLEEDRPNWSSITDFVRGTITAPTVSDLQVAVLRTNQAMRKSGFRQVYFRDRFNDPTPTKYADIQMVYEHEATGHKCELLATTSAMWLAKEVKPTSAGEGGHALYEKSRTIEEEAETSDAGINTENANKLVALTDEQVKVYGEGLKESMASPTLYAGSGGG